MDDVCLPRLDVRRKSGDEVFHDGPAPLGFDLRNFWQWSASDLVSNALRGRLAEFLVAKALGIADGVRTEWDAYDLRTATGLTIEVKSAAYVQSWAQRAPSTICCDIAPTRFWDATTNVLATDIRRQADLYVFALLKHPFNERTLVDPTDVSQWEFFVTPAATLNARMPNQKQLGLSTLLKLGPLRCVFAELRGVVERTSATTGE